MAKNNNQGNAQKQLQEAAARDAQLDNDDNVSAEIEAEDELEQEEESSISREELRAQATDALFGAMFAPSKAHPISSENKVEASAVAAAADNNEDEENDDDDEVSLDPQERAQLRFKATDALFGSASTIAVHKAQPPESEHKSVEEEDDTPPTLTMGSNAQRTFGPRNEVLFAGAQLLKKNAQENEDKDSTFTGKDGKRYAFATLSQHLDNITTIASKLKFKSSSADLMPEYEFAHYRLPEPDYSLDADDSSVLAMGSQDERTLGDQNEILFKEGSNSSAQNADSKEAQERARAQEAVFDFHADVYGDDSKKRSRLIQKSAMDCLKRLMAEMPPASTYVSRKGRHPHYDVFSEGFEELPLKVRERSCTYFKNMQKALLLAEKVLCALPPNCTSQEMFLICHKLHTENPELPLKALIYPFGFSYVNYKYHEKQCLIPHEVKEKSTGKKATKTRSKKVKDVTKAQSKSTKGTTKSTKNSYGRRTRNNYDSYDSKSYDSYDRYDDYTDLRDLGDFGSGIF